MSVNENESKVKDDAVTEPVENIPEPDEGLADTENTFKNGVLEEMNSKLVDDKVSKVKSSDSIASENNGNAGFIDKYPKKNIIVVGSLIAFILGILIGRFSQPRGKLDSVLVTESASVEDSGKEYTQIVEYHGQRQTLVGRTVL